MLINGGTLNGGLYQDKSNLVTNGLKLYLDSGNSASYPRTGTTWYDLSGEGYTTTINAGMAYYPDNNGIFVFNGNPDAFAQVPSGFGYDYSAGFTVNVWANFYSGGSGWERLIDFGNGAGVDNLVMTNAGENPGHVLMSIDANNDDVAGALTPGEMPITWDGWAMYTIYCDGTYWKQYKNGAFYSYKGASILPASVTRNLNYIGKSNWEDPYFYGQMSVIQLYNRALTEDEILRTYYYFKGRYGL